MQLFLLYSLRLITFQQISPSSLRKNIQWPRMFSPAFKSNKKALLNYFSMPWLFVKISIFHDSYFNSLTFPWSWRIMFPRPFPDVGHFWSAVCLFFRPSPPTKAFPSKRLTSMRVSEMKHIFIWILRVARSLVWIPRQSQLGKGLLTYALFRDHGI